MCVYVYVCAFCSVLLSKELMTIVNHSQFMKSPETLKWCPGAPIKIERLISKHSPFLTTFQVKHHVIV